MTIAALNAKYSKQNAIYGRVQRIPLINDILDYAAEQLEHHPWGFDDFDRAEFEGILMDMKTQPLMHWLAVSAAFRRAGYDIETPGLARVLTRHRQNVIAHDDLVDLIADYEEFERITA